MVESKQTNCVVKSVGADEDVVECRAAAAAARLIDSQHSSLFCTHSTLYAHFCLVGLLNIE